MHTAPRTAIGFHVTLRLADDRPLYTKPADLRVIARVVIEQGERRGLIAFGAADNHLHAELVGDQADASAFVQYVATSLRWRLAPGAPFERARVRPRVDERHAYDTFHYVLRQDTRHGLARDHAREGTCLPDLLGWRLLTTGIVARVRARLPRLDRDALLAHVPAAAFGTRDPPPVETLRDAACAAFALTDLHARTPDAVRARRAAIQAAGDGASSRAIAEHLGIHLRTVQAVRCQPVDAPAVRAVTLQGHLARSRPTAPAAPDPP